MQAAIEVAGTTTTIVSAFLSKVALIACLLSPCTSLQQEELVLHNASFR
jgi:hypothetical protein